MHLSVEDGNDHESKFSIKAQSLESLELVPRKLTNFILKNAKSLIKAEIYLRQQFAKEQPDRAIQLLQRISDIKFLSLSDDSFQFQGCVLPTFEYLNHLKLRLRDWTYGRLLPELLQKFPKLECFDIDYWFPSRKELSLPEFVPFCVLSHLKTISIRGFEGRQVEMEAAKYLLRNGRVLEMMTIYTGFQYRKEKLLYKEFLMFQRGSVNCQVEFVKRK